LVPSAAIGANWNDFFLYLPASPSPPKGLGGDAPPAQQCSPQTAAGPEAKHARQGPTTISV
jgi:hypothetical protein